MKVEEIKDFLHSKGCGSELIDGNRFFYDVETVDIKELIKLHVTEFKNNIESELKSTCNACMMSEEISTNLELILNAYNLDEIK